MIGLSIAVNLFRIDNRLKADSKNLQDFRKGAEFY